MAIDRRSLLKAAAALGVAPIATLVRADGSPAFIAACREGADTYAVAALDELGAVLFREELDGRAHDVAVSPDGAMAVVFARRPGRFALVLDILRRRRAASFAPPPDRHFYGHGVFAEQGRLLLATENDYAAERGVLGVYDVAAGFRRIGELPTHGVGPHQCLLLRDGRTVVVANGGIATHPDFGRAKLNLATMEPSLAYLEAATGDLLEQVVLPQALHQLSVRHLAETADGAVWFGGQYEGPETDPVELVGTHRRGEEIALIAAPPTAYAGMRQYVGAVAANRTGTRVAATSPVGGSVLVWDTATRTLVGTHRIADVCGVAPDARGFLLTDGRGSVWQDDRLLQHLDDVAWDNHIQPIG